MSRRLARKYREYKISTFLTPIVDFQLKFLNRSERCTVDMYYVGISKTVVDMWTFPKLLQTLWTFPQTVCTMQAFPKPLQICRHFQNRCGYVNISKTVIDMWAFPKPLQICGHFQNRYRYVDVSKTVKEEVEPNQTTTPGSLLYFASGGSSGHIFSS